jgi:hypothetical protein
MIVPTLRSHLLVSCKTSSWSESKGSASSFGYDLHLQPTGQCARASFVVAEEDAEDTSGPESTTHYQAHCDDSAKDYYDDNSGQQPTRELPSLALVDIEQGRYTTDR